MIQKFIVQVTLTYIAHATDVSNNIRMATSTSLIQVDLYVHRPALPQLRCDKSIACTRMQITEWAWPILRSLAWQRAIILY